MGIKKYKPITPGLRFKVLTDCAELTKKHPERSLLATLRKSGGRNNRGRVTMRRRGGGHKRRYRIVDFRRDTFDVPARVSGIEYDPNRSSRIALLEYEDGSKRYILWPDGLRVGDSVVSASDSQVDIKPGNAMKLSHIPLGTVIHNIELHPGKGGVLVRSAGGSAQLMAKEKEFAQIKMPSGEIRLIRVQCRATVGQLGNIEHGSVVHGKAGRVRWLGRRPKVRGVAMNPVDHPHGGGEGRAGQGNPHPVTPWGKPTKGGKTRNPRKRSGKFIVKGRIRKKRK